MAMDFILFFVFSPILKLRLVTGSTACNVAQWPDLFVLGRPLKAIILIGLVST
jgi:hypothetical protein